MFIKYCYIIYCEQQYIILPKAEKQLNLTSLAYLIDNLLRRTSEHIHKYIHTNMRFISLNI